MACGRHSTVTCSWCLIFCRYSLATLPTHSSPVHVLARQLLHLVLLLALDLGVVVLLLPSLSCLVRIQLFIQDLFMSWCFTAKRGSSTKIRRCAGSRRHHNLTEICISKPLTPGFLAGSGWNRKL